MSRNVISPKTNKLLTTQYFFYLLITYLLIY